MLLPPGISLTLEQTEQDDQLLSLTVATTSADAPCPVCHQPSTGVHSYYERRLTDLPVQGLTLRFQIRVRRFYCRLNDCPRRVFCERLHGLAPAYARQTSRLTACLYLVAQALGGNAGARLAERLSLPASATTLLRRLHQTSTAPSLTPRVVGIDDWAYRRGQRYGTIVVDLEQRQVVDLLPDRTAETVATWLTAHPEIELVSRDRAGAYAEAARKGAPQAGQVADRWHLLHNLTEAVQRVVERHYGQLREVARESKQTPALEQQEAASPSPIPAPSAVETRKQIRQQQQQERCSEVLRLHAEGVPIKAIATQLGMHRRTVRQWVRTGELPPRTKPKRRACELDRYADYLARRWAEGVRNATQLGRELRARGFAGSARGVRHWIRQHYRSGKRPTAGPGMSAALFPSPRQVAWVLLDGPKPVEETTRALVEQFRRRVPAIDQSVQLAGEFALLLRERRAQGLDGWLSRATSSGLASFAAGLRRDLSAVRQAFVSPWSQGQVEGQVNRLKMLKRQMYGRASFSLLRTRVLFGQNRAPTVTLATN